VLLVDFDNIVSKTAPEFADHPLSWVRWLEAGGLDPDGRRRRFLVKRVYWNSHNEVYREVFEAAGFEAFACRAEAKSKKSTADMVLALDAVDLLHAEDRIREFIVLTTDTDFVPLVDRLQDRDRRVVVMVDERDVSSAVYRPRADLVITRHALSDAAQTPLEAYRQRFGLWGRVTAGPFPVHTKTPRKVRKARAKSEPAMALAAELVARDLMGRRVRRIERERLPRLLARIEDFTAAGTDADRWLGWGDEAAFVEALAERDDSLVITRTRRGAPQLELSEKAFQTARGGGGPGFDLTGAAAEIARIASERPGLMLNRARVTKLLAGFPTFTTSGARPFMGCATYRSFIRALVDLRDDLKFVSTPDGGVAISYIADVAERDRLRRERDRRAEAREGKSDDSSSPLLPPGAAIAEG
jgi:uncharacterized LabA/DUF88 family protein